MRKFVEDNEILFSKCKSLSDFRQSYKVTEGVRGKISEKEKYKFNR